MPRCADNSSLAGMSSWPNPVSQMTRSGQEKTLMLTLRLTALVVVVILLTMHARSVRVFRWEQSISGGILVTYSIASLGLCICAGQLSCGAHFLQTYLTTVGAVLFAMNAIGLWGRWHTTSEVTHMVAELLITLGVNVKRQLKYKIFLSVIYTLIMILDACLAPKFLPDSPKVKVIDLTVKL